MLEQEPKKDFFNELKDQECKRFRRAVEKAKIRLLQERFAGTGLTFDESKRCERIFNQLEALILLTNDKFFEHLPSPLEKKRGRSMWEVYLSSLIYLARRYPRGFCRKTVLSLGQWQDLPAKCDAYIEQLLSWLSDLMFLVGPLERYCQNLEKAENLARRYSYPQEVSKLYAVLKTWKYNDDFQAFEDSLQSVVGQMIEIIIEGPIQLYLLINEDNWFLILKFLAAETLSEYSENLAELQDLRDINHVVYGGIKNSELFKSFKELLGESISLYLIDLIKDFKTLRAQYPTEDSKTKFLSVFEKGDLYKIED